MSNSAAIVVTCPGDTIAAVPSTGVIKVDSAIHRVGQQLRASLAGVRKANEKRFSVQSCSKRYSARESDRVIGVVSGAVLVLLLVGSRQPTRWYVTTQPRAACFSDEYKLDIKGPCHATLPALAFEAATKRNRPKLDVGDIVLCCITRAIPTMEPEASCVDIHGKADGMGPLNGGYCFDTTTSHCQKLWGKPHELEYVDRSQAGEVAIGLNGRVWVNSDSPGHTAAIVKLLKACERLHLPDAVNQVLQQHLSNFSIDNR